MYITPAFRETHSRTLSLIHVYPATSSFLATMPSSILPLSILLLSFSLTLAHQSISYPIPITRDVACRISSNAHCTGPCPSKFRRYDQTPNNPSVTIRRGSTLTVNTLANNHRGGFSRWSLVHVRDMYDKKKHRDNAFLFTCADVRVTKCSSINKKRDCNYDAQNEYYRHKVTIPRNIPDGVYVLGWVWFGGGWRWGHFGDYYDCLFIQVKGGPLSKYHWPVFKPGPSPTRKNDRCVATVDQPGVCWREPCPGGGKWTSYMKPAEFSNGRRPKAIPTGRYNKPHKPPKRKKGSVKIRSLTVRSADHPERVISRARSRKFMHVFLTKGMRSTVTCEVSGKVRSVTFYVNGETGRTDYSEPYSIAGDWVEYRSQQVKFAPWAFDIGATYVTLSCKAVGLDGIEDWMNVELSTLFY